VLTNRNCGCEIHDIGCFAAVAVAQSFGFHTTRIIDQRLLRYSNPSEYMKESQSNLEETLRRLVDFQQHKLVPRFPPNQNGRFVCRDVFLYLMRVPASTYTEMLLKISDPDVPLLA
jgi:chemotaxis methyl-accepting protein methylase